ncbi:MAG: DcrB-related protein [Candidatus Peregrinibacteria bacterium]|nr:DcrB-related protein [Candidatus Peregrinibacteria bacterium]
MRLKQPKKVAFIIILLGLLILPGCFGSDGEETVDPTSVEQLAFYRLVEADDFSMQIPEDWETITQFTSSYPTNTIVAFRNNNKDNNFLANINIVRNTVEEGTTSADYALETFGAISGQLINYKLHDQQEIDLIVENTTTITYLYEFEGTNDPTTEVVQFIQLYAVKGTNGYIITGTYKNDDSELSIDQVKQSMPTFQLK